MLDEDTNQKNHWPCVIGFPISITMFVQSYCFYYFTDKVEHHLRCWWV